MGAPAPKGNTYWKNRKKTVPGREQAFKSPEELWEKACEYFEWCDNNPWIKKDWKGRDAYEVEVPTQKPYTIGGFCDFCNLTHSWWNRAKDKDYYPEFQHVFEAIDNIISNQLFEGAAVGTFNASLIARKLGLADKQETDVTSKGEEIKQVFVVNGQKIEF